MPKAATRLSLRHRKMLDFYYTISKLNKTDALRRAKYAHPNKQHGIFSYPSVKAEMVRREKRVEERYDVNYDRLMKELATVAYATVLDFWAVADDGTLTLDLKNTDVEAMRAIGELTIVTRMEGRGENLTEVVTVKMKPWNKLTALEALIRHAGLSKEKIVVEGELKLVDRLRAAQRRVQIKPEEDDG